MEKRESYSHILKYTSLFGSVQVLNVLVGLVRNKFVAMILGPQGMGLVSLFTSSLSLLENSTNLGLPMSATREVAEVYENKSRKNVDHTIDIIRTWSVLTAIAGMVICILISPLLNKWTFSWGNHTLHFVLLSPIVALTAITGGEIAILKATRQLRKIAMISIYGVIASFLISIPIYYLFGMSGIVPSLVLIALCQSVFTLYYSLQLYPWRFCFRRKTIVQGLRIVRIGIAFVFAGIIGSGSEFVIRSFLNNVGNEETVGLYNACYMMIFTYAGMVFSAMETDFFPRLSAVPSIGHCMNNIVNMQIEVSLLILSPLLVVFIVAMPILLPLLYSGKFLPVIDMVQIAALSLYMRAVYLPLEYIPLSRGDSKVYMSMELLSSLVLAPSVIYGFIVAGLWGAGCAMTLASLGEVIGVYIYYRIRYKYRFSKFALVCFLVQLCFGLSAYALTMVTSKYAYCILSLVLVALSTTVSLITLLQKTDFLAKIKKKYSKNNIECNNHCNK